MACGSDTVESNVDFSGNGEVIKMYLMTDGSGIVEIPKKKPIRALFCKHRNVIYGEACSKNGMHRISGCDIYRVCEDCGKILDEQHTDY